MRRYPYSPPVSSFGPGPLTPAVKWLLIANTAMFVVTLFFREGPVRTWSDAAACDTKRFASWHKGMLERGVYWPPSQFEAAFLSGAHTEADIAQTITAARAALA